MVEGINLRAALNQPLCVQLKENTLLLKWGIRTLQSAGGKRVLPLSFGCTQETFLFFFKLYTFVFPQLLFCCFSLGKLGQTQADSLCFCSVYINAATLALFMFCRVKTARSLKYLLFPSFWYLDITLFMQLLKFLLLMSNCFL